MNELAAALGDDANFATTVTNSLATKAVDTAVVHLAGTETITGQKNFTGGILSTDLNNRNVFYMLNGAGSLKWHLSHHTDFHLTESGVADYRFVVKAGGNVGISCMPQYVFDVNSYP